MAHLQPLHISAKLPRRFRWIMLAIRVLRRVGWRPSDAQASRIASWVADRSDVTISQGKPDRDNSGPVLDASP